MKVFYECCVRIIYYLIWCSRFFLPEYRKWIDSRIIQENYFKTNEKLNTSIWFHCASLGELEQARPLMRNIKNDDPGVRIVLSFFSTSAAENFEIPNYIDKIFFNPVDTRNRVNKFLDFVNPSLVIFVENEIWLNHLWALEKKEIPFIFLASKFRKDQFWFNNPIGKSLVSVLKKSKVIFVQNQKAAQLLKMMDNINTEVAGNSRVDRVLEWRESVRPMPLVEEFIGSQKVIVFGSIHPEDKIIFKALVDDLNEYKCILAPHHLNHEFYKNIRNLLNSECVNYSTLKSKNMRDCRFLIMDNVGFLFRIYQYASIVYIGGGFGKGIHNILEPASFGAPIFIGPKFHKFDEAQALVDSGGVACIHSGEEFIKRTLEIDNPHRHKSIQKKLYDYLQANKGATDRIYSYLRLKQLI